MQISCLNNFSFKLKGKDVNLMIGFLTKKDLTEKIDIVISLADIHKAEVEKLEKKPFIITSPGEYEISNASVFGLPNIFIIEIDEIRFCYLVKPDKMITDDLLEEVDGIDVLLLPLNDKTGLNLKEVVKNTNQIRPKIILPCGNLLDQFVKEMGYENLKRDCKLVISKNSLPEETEVVILES